MPPPRATTQRAFSLVEMLAALAIISILIAIAVPAVSSYGRSTALATGGNMVANLAALARQTAIARNSMAALVLLGAQGTEEDFRAFTVAEYRPGEGWVQLTDWKILPIGIVVDSSAPLASTFLLNSPRPFPFLAGPPRQTNPPLSFQGQNISDGPGYAARIFLPGGGLLNPQHPAQIRMVEGIFQAGQVTHTRRGAAGQPANYYDLTILGATGITKVFRP